ncbi:MAG: Holliday junction branch migration DNA helicase RuvB [Geminocystis sp.]|nr:Holliday junction branch migration DNA helicase RuvB [Geminocystis sp.]MCS7148517.1 Holliday junction branch migration DNA helicase RuvB [Geminocystis sp.]MDW8464175.1 Holliday junction branch migration DNA helicase RuvB [Geminocystis sp.]
MGKANSIARPEILEEDLRENESEEKIRPRTLAEYVGQKELKRILEIAMTAAKQRNEPLEHILLYGPPGLGKTTLSLILAAEMGVNCKVTTAVALERPRDIIGLLLTLQPGDILFIDEIHRLHRQTEEILYPAMEDRRLDITIGKKQGARIGSISLPPFTIVGATTKIGALTSPLRERFGLIQRLHFYQPEELKEIVLRSAKILRLCLDDGGAEAIACRSRGTPRVANRLLRRIRDYALVVGQAVITSEIVEEAAAVYGIDSLGLDTTDRLLLSTIINQFQGGPVGLDALAATMGEDAKTIEEVCEPYLLQLGFILRTPRGRLVTEKAYKHMSSWS